MDVQGIGAGIVAELASLGAKIHTCARTEVTRSTEIDNVR